MNSLALKIIIFATILLPTSITAKELSNPQFSLLSTQDGLSQKTVQAILQDSKGFLWFGTQEGLNKYDGQRITVFRHSAGNSNSISNDVIRDIIEDQNGNIWIATSEGLNRYIDQNNSFERVALINPKGEKVKRLNALYIDRQNHLWVGTDGNGVFKASLNEENVKFIIPEILENLAKADIRAVFEDSRGRVWIGTDGQGIQVLNDLQNSRIEYVHSSDIISSLSHNRIRSIIEDSKGQIWIGTRGGGVNRFNERTKSFSRYQFDREVATSLSHNRVYQIFEDNEKLLWFATDGGISIYQAETDDFLRIQHLPSRHSSLSHNRVLSILQDSGNVIWFGTLSGVNKWNPVTAEFVNYNHAPEVKSGLSFSHIHGLAESKGDEVFIATFGGGLNVYNKRTNSFHVNLVENSEISDNYIITLFVDQKNQLWVGTLSKGVEVFDSDFKKVANFQSDKDDNSSLSDNGITSILKDIDGEVWVSTYRAGLNRLINGTKQFKHYRLSENKSGLKSENIFQVIEDDDGYLWLATDGGGISRLDKNSDEIISFVHDPGNSNSLSGNAAWSIYQDSKGRFWIGTQGHGLNRWEANDRRRGINNFIRYNVDNGLNSSTVNGVVEDDQGYIWISTVKGVSRLDPETNDIMHFNLSDEIHQNELNQGAILKSNDGRLYFGGLDGISAFSPSAIKQNHHVPPVVLTKITSENRELFFDEPLHTIQEVTFDHSDYLIAFEFAALDFAQPNKNRYQYKLEGFDADWIDGGQLNRATFTNLPSGHYILKVRGSNNDGVWSADSINLKVNILPAPWVSWWAFAFYGLAFCVLLIYMIRSQAKRLASEEVFREQVSEKVAEKTNLYNKNNDFLKAQLDQFKYRSNVDLDTGLPNQKYLCDIVASSINCIDQFQNEGIESPVRLCVAIIRLPEIVGHTKENTYLQTFKHFSHFFHSQDERFRVLARWGVNEIGIVEYFSEQASCHSRLKEYIDELKEAFELASEQSDDLTINMSYSLAPFDGVYQSFIDGEKIMMISEHVLHLIDNESDINIVGIVKVNQLINNISFNQILEADRLSEISDVFGLATE